MKAIVFFNEAAIPVRAVGACAQAIPHSLAVRALGPEFRDVAARYTYEFRRG